MPGLLIASPHRYPDLARLWYRSVSRDLAPALRKAGFEVQVLIFADANQDRFAPSLFPGARLEFPHPDCRDFVEFYDWALQAFPEFARMLFLDADVFVLDGDWIARRSGWLDRDDVAAISFLPRNQLPGVYALLCRPEVYRTLEPPVFAASCEQLEEWPNSVNRGPGESAVVRLRSLGWKVLEVGADEAGRHLADFHGTTVVRVSRELFGDVIGERRFERLISEKRYFAMGAYDNILLATLYGALFDEPFAAANGNALTGSVTVEGFRRALQEIREPRRWSELVAYFQRSDRAILRLAQRERVEMDLPKLVPESWRRETKQPCPQSDKARQC